jgi:hypothetical protein
MKTSNAIRTFTIIVLVFYILYALTNMGMTGLLFSAAVGFFLYNYTENVDYAIMGTVIAGIILNTVVLFFSKKEKFQDNAEVISKRVIEIKKPFEQYAEPKGIYNDMYASYGNIEGFEDVPKETSDTPISPVISDISGEKKEAFEAPIDASMDFLFKPGETPTERKGGYHIDAGTTILNALNGLNPNQIQSMTSDTQKLMETQKSLLSLLNTMKPMLADVKPLMETFGQMFAK